MSEIALDIRHITKEYKLYKSEKDRLKEAFNPFKKSYHTPFYALNDINITIKNGEKVGIIGSNGAGKSTLLKVITGVLRPTEGEIIANGRIAALLELGAGFNMDYTGIENIKLNGTLMGKSDEEVESKLQDIIDFANIGDFIYQPVKNYSSGMFVRLAFATQIFSEPDILIVDEALSVGDIRFQQKCFRAMDSLMKNKTVVLVTHDTAAVTRFCERVIWINQGKVVFDGAVDEGLKKYQEFIINQAIEEKSNDENNEFEDLQEIHLEESKGKYQVPEINPLIQPKGNGEARVLRCGLFDKNNKQIEFVEPGQKVYCVVHIHFQKRIFHPILGLAFRDRLGNDIIGINSETIGQPLKAADNDIEYVIEFIMPELNKGHYTISIAIASGYQADHVQLCWVDDAVLFQVRDREFDIPGTFYLSKGKIETYHI